MTTTRRKGAAKRSNRVRDIRTPVARPRPHWQASWTKAPYAGVIKLTATDVFNIREMRELGYKMMEIAEEFGVTGSCISQVCTRKTWRNVK